MPLDQACAAFVQQVKQARTKSMTDMTPVEVREGTAKLRPLFGAGPEMHAVQSITIEHAHGAFDARLLTPMAIPRGLIVYYHGGGWVTGHIDDFDVLGRKLAAQSGCEVLLVNYRLAPEHRYPAPVQDAQAALDWAFKHAQQAAGGARPVIVLGDSAGANLATVVARHNRDAGSSKVAMQVLVYPVTDCDFERPSYTAAETQALLDRSTMLWYWNHYQPDAAARKHPDLSPLHAESLAGMPPTLLLTAECDPLRDEGEAYATSLVMQGNDVEFKRYAGQIHGFLSMINILPASEAAIQHIASYIKRRLSA